MGCVGGGGMRECGVCGWRGRGEGVGIEIAELLIDMTI